MGNYDFVPSNDAEFNLWQTSLIDIVSNNVGNWEISTADFASLKDWQTKWIDAYGKASNKQNRTSADVQAKNDARVIFEPAIRSFVAQWLSNNSKVANSDKERMGLTVKSTSRKAAPTPDSRPLATVDFSVRLQHTLHFYDEASPRSKAKPKGVHGCEIWMKMGGDAPKSASELSYIATDTATPYTVNFDGADAGKTVYYWLRWVNTRSERGPWSSQVSAMVVG